MSAVDEAAERYYSYLREYLVEKHGPEQGGRIAERAITARMITDLITPLLRGNSPMQSHISPSGKTIVRWVENADTVDIIGFISRHGKLPREDAGFMREIVEKLAEKVTGGKQIQTGMNEYSGPLLRRKIGKALKEKGIDMKVNVFGTEHVESNGLTTRTSLSATDNELPYHQLQLSLERSEPGVEGQTKKR